MRKKKKKKKRQKEDMIMEEIYDRENKFINLGLFFFIFLHKWPATETNEPT